jgi:hypothetical protein
VSVKDSVSSVRTVAAIAIVLSCRAIDNISTSRLVRRGVMIRRVVRRADRGSALARGGV